VRGYHWALLLGLLFAGLLTADLIRGRTLLARREYSRERKPLGYWAGISVLLFLTVIIFTGAADLWRSGCEGFVSNC